MFFVFAIPTLLSSCVTTIVNKLDLNSSTPIIEKLPVKNKEIYFLGMAHVAKKEFYDNTKMIVENLQSEGFVFYVESVKELNVENLIVDTISFKKIRKITNLDLGQKYSKGDNELLQKIIKKYNLVDQPKYEILGVKNYKRVDYNITQLIDFYEKKYGVVKLDSCDYTTNLGNKYSCKTVKNTQRLNFTNDIIFEVRNNLVVDSILHSSDKKIVIIYGKAHLEGIKNELNNQIKN